MRELTSFATDGGTKVQLRWPGIESRWTRVMAVRAAEPAATALSQRRRR